MALSPESSIGETNYVCRQRDNCPYLGFRKAAEVMAERDYLRSRVSELEQIMNSATQAIVTLQEKLKIVEAEKQSLQAELHQALRKPFKPNKQTATSDANDTAPRKTGAPPGHRGATRKRPAKIDAYIKVTHQHCRYCGSAEVTTYETFKEHVVSDIEFRVKHTCFLMHYGYCRQCKKVLYPKVAGIIPNSHIGPVARAVGEYLRYSGVPDLKVARLFTDVLGLELTHPSLIGFDKILAKNGEAV